MVLVRMCLGGPTALDLGRSGLVGVCSQRRHHEPGSPAHSPVRADGQAAAERGGRGNRLSILGATGRQVTERQVSSYSRWRNRLAFLAVDPYTLVTTARGAYKTVHQTSQGHGGLPLGLLNRVIDQFQGCCGPLHLP